MTLHNSCLGNIKLVIICRLSKARQNIEEASLLDGACVYLTKQNPEGHYSIYPSSLFAVYILFIAINQKVYATAAIPVWATSNSLYMQVVQCTVYY